MLTALWQLILGRWRHEHVWSIECRPPSCVICGQTLKEWTA